MATLNIWNSFEITAQGLQRTGKHGLAASAFADPFDATVTGLIDGITGSLTTATVVKVYDASADVPATWVYTHFWADQITYLQIIGTATNVIVRVAAYEPFVLPGYSTMLAAGDTTVITGGTEPTLTQIGSIYVGNYSGSTANYAFTVIK